MASNALGNSGGRLYSFGAQPVLIDCNFVVDSTNGNGLGIRSLKGQGVANVYMHTSATPAAGNPNPAAGYALVQLSSNYNRYLGGFSGLVSPVTGSPLAINASALTPGVAYIIASPGHAAEGQATIAPVADVSGSLASKYIVLYDAYGNTWVIWFSVSGVGVRPQLGNAAADGSVGLHYVQQSIVTNDTAATIGADLVVTISNLPSGTTGVNSFTASGTTTVTIVNTSSNPYHLPGVPTDGLAPLNTGFTLALTVDDHNIKDWQAVGLPKGLVPTAGQSFIATAAGAGSSTGTAIAVGVSGINSMEVIGDPNQSLSPAPQGGSPNVGGWILVQLLGPTSAGSTVQKPTAPVNGSVVGMSFYVDARLSPSNVNGRNP